jgi:hypothetical protein
MLVFDYAMVFDVSGVNFKEFVPNEDASVVSSRSDEAY